VIKLLYYHEHVKKNNIAQKYDDIKRNDSISQFLKLVKNRQMTIAKLSLDDKLKDGYCSFDLLNKVPYIEEKIWFSNATNLHHNGHGGHAVYRHTFPHS
jgi:hypothetical protein